MKKINIANKFLLPKQIKENGVKNNELEITDGTIKEIIKKLYSRVRSKKFRKRNF